MRVLGSDPLSRVLPSRFFAADLADEVEFLEKKVSRDTDDPVRTGLRSRALHCLRALAVVSLPEVLVSPRQYCDRSRDERDLTNRFISCVLQRIIRKVTSCYCTLEVNSYCELV